MNNNIEAVIEELGISNNEAKKNILEALLFSPKCWKDGKYKFDRDPCGMTCTHCIKEAMEK